METSDLTSIASVNSGVAKALENAKTSVAEMSSAMSPKTGESVSTKWSPEQLTKAEVLEELVASTKSVETIVNAVADTSLTFSVEDELSRMVVAVRVVGSDEVIRQFPPEEFITVAKHIAAQNPEMIDEDYLKGILFDQYT